MCMFMCGVCVLMCDAVPILVCGACVCCLCLSVGCVCVCVCVCDAVFVSALVSPIHHFGIFFSELSQTFWNLALKRH